MSALLLDTHAAIWFLDGDLRDEALEELVSAALDDGVVVSPVTAWEAGLLARPGRNRRPEVNFEDGIAAWYARLLATSGVSETPLTAQILIASTQLPGEFHSDPADRMLVATARTLGARLMTRDRQILGYAEAGHVETVPC